ncbi:DNA polymerase epsilon subunit 4-like [Porites lutea]|uniref:DNA polymerase epsilon subunit 4-like n=1 Tax=Porites lutea TaxID=51062 RepID=UPI003CC5BECA
MADEVEQAVVTTEGNAQNEEAAVGRLTQFPQTRVRNMMKIDPDLHLANRESVFLLTKAAELFVEYFAKEAHKRTVIGKRKTIQRRDLDTTIDENEEMAFLEGTLD